DALYHFGHLSDIPNPEIGARQAFEKAFRLDSLYAGPIGHMGRVALLAGDTAAHRLWNDRLIALDPNAEALQLARWDRFRTAQDSVGAARFLDSLRSGPSDVARTILLNNTLDSFTIAFQPALLAVHQAQATTP